MRCRVPDHASLGIEVAFFDKFWPPDEEPERWQKTRADIEQAVRAALAANGFTEEEYDITQQGD
jgi:hypothetical protein